MNGESYSNGEFTANYAVSDTSHVVTGITAELVNGSGVSLNPKVEESLGTALNGTSKLKFAPTVTGDYRVKIDVANTSSTPLVTKMSSTITATIPVAPTVPTITGINGGDYATGSFTATYEVNDPSSVVTGITAELVDDVGTSLTPKVTQDLSTTLKGAIALGYTPTATGKYKIKLDVTNTSATTNVSQLSTSIDAVITTP